MTVRDHEGGADSRLFQVTVTDVAESPVANAGGPYHTVEGQDLELDGSASHDPDDAPGVRSIVKYEWDFNYNAAVGFQPDFESSTATPFCRWIEELSRRGGIIDDGSYTIALVVTDDTGRRSDPTTTPFTVGNDRPTLSVSGSPIVATGSSASFTFSSLDPGDDTISHIFIDWGDGSPIEMAAVTEGSKDPGTAATSRTKVIPHVFDTKGNYSVEFYAVDEDNDPATSTATASPTTPTRQRQSRSRSAIPRRRMPGPPVTTYDFNAVVLDATRSTDDGEIKTYTWTQVSGPHVFRGLVTPASAGTTNIEWDLDNDGQFDDAVTPNVRLILPASGTLGPGNYVFELTVSDDLGLSGSDTTSIEVLEISRR